MFAPLVKRACTCWSCWDGNQADCAPLSFERRSTGSHNQSVPLVSDSSSLYGSLYVDLPGRDMKTFYSKPLPKLPGLHTRVPEPLGSPDTSPLPQYLHTNASGKLSSAVYDRRGRNWKAAAYTPPRLTLRESWEKNCKKELHHMNSAPLLPFNVPSETGESTPGTRSLDMQYGGQAEYAKVMKTFSTPKILQYTASLKVIDVLPPPPPMPAANAFHQHAKQQETSNSPKLPKDFKAKQLYPEAPKISGCAVQEKMAPPSATCSRLSTTSLSMSINDERDNVLTPQDVAEYLEFNEDREHQSDSSSPVSRDFSSPHAYGYICSPLPSDLAEAEPADEDEDPELDEACDNSLKFYRKYCHTPSSSISEYESSLGSSLANGWGSISEDNFTSARCSMVSSSDGSFLMDANFAQALAVAVDSFCFGMSQGEPAESDKTYADFSPPSSPLDGIFSSQDLYGNGTVATKNQKSDLLPALEWSTDLIKEMEAQYTQKHVRKSPNYAEFGKQRVNGVFGGNASVSPSISSENDDISGIYSTSKIVSSGAPATCAFSEEPSQKSFTLWRKLDKIPSTVDPSGLSVVKV